mgnify:CR=1 FL=1
MAKNNNTTAATEQDYQQWIQAKKDQRKEWLKQSETGEISDEDNPAFLFNGINTSILLKIASGEISAQFLAHMELVNRGLDKAGKWVGFKEAEKIHFN